MTYGMEKTIHIYKPFLISMTLHAVVVLLLIQLGGDFISKEWPVVVDLTFAEPAITTTVNSHDADSKNTKSEESRREQSDASPMQSSHADARLEPIMAERAENPLQKGMTPSLEPGRQSTTVTPPGGSTDSSFGKSVQTGSRSGEEIGPGGPVGNGTGSSAEQLRRKYLKEHFVYIQNLIKKRLTYPRKALKEGWSGTVQVAFVILESGHVTDIKILKSSGYEILNSNVIDTIRAVSPFPKPPVKAELHMQIPYLLEE